MDYNIWDYGAVGDGITVNTGAIQKAIDACSLTGGRVVVPAGSFMSGTLRLRSNVELHLEMGSTLIESHDPKDMIDYTETESSSNNATGMDGIKDGYFIYACHEKNIAITGFGKIDGQGRDVYYDADNDNGFHEAPLSVKGFRPRTTYLEDVEGLNVRDITFFDSSFWTLHMAGCKNVIIDNIRILNNDRGPNNDGIDPDSCKNVVIRGCLIESGDDAVVLKTTKPITEKYGPCENIVISGCIMHSRDSAVKIGTETWGDIKNVVIADCVADSCSRGVGIWVRDSATISDIRIHHLTGTTRRYAEYAERPTGWWGKGEPLFMSATYRNAEKRTPGIIRNVTVDNLNMASESGFFMASDGDGVIEDIAIKDSRLEIRKQSVHTPGLFDEQPSLFNVYEHPMTWLYNRNGRNIKVECDIKIDEEMKEFFNTEPIEEKSSL